RRTDGTGPRAADLLSVLSVAGLLLGCVGGFGYLFSLALNPWIRCYYRVSVYLAFFGLFAAALVLNRLTRALAKRQVAGYRVHGLVVLLLALGLLDQTG